MGDNHMQQQKQQQMNAGLELPPGFRFHPTDEEIITSYLAPKVLDRSFCPIAIGEVDLNKSEPWELPGKAKMGEMTKEWYFYCQKDRKYPTGMRTNRATEAGYWKATGKDKEIYHVERMEMLIGMKKTLVFYKGRAPRGEKTNWVMHEYRLEGRLPYPNTAIARSSKDEWVVCRIFNKSSVMKKVVPSYAMSINDQRCIPMAMSMGIGMGEQGFSIVDSTSTMPPIMDTSSLYTNASVVAQSASSYLVGPSLATGMGSTVLPMNGQYVGNHQMHAPHPMFYQQQHMGEAGYIAEPASGPSSMASQDTGASSEQNNASATEISSVNMAMDGMWKY